MIELRLIVGGLTNAAVANALFISEKTVKSHIDNILSKLQPSPTAPKPPSTRDAAASSGGNLGHVRRCLLLCRC
jgi:DNA-binding NarL/FixJ family response regulator